MNPDSDAHALPPEFPREAVDAAELSGRPGTLDALRNIPFLLLFLGNVLQFGSMQMQQLVRGYLVFQFTGSFAALGFIALANGLPGLILAPVGGVVADRLPRKTVIQTTQLVNGLNTASLAVFAIFGLLSFEQLVISAVVQGATNAMLMPSRQAIIGDLVGRDRLMNAIGLSTMGQNLMQTVGPGLGGVIMTLLNPAAAFAVMASMYFLAFFFTVRIPARPLYANNSRRQSPGLRGSLIDLVEGMKYVAMDRTIRTLIAVNFIIVLCSQPYTQMMPGFVDTVLHKGASEMGWLLTISGVGAIIGSLVVASLPARNRGRLLVIVAIVVSITLVLFSSISNYYAIMPVMLALGVGNAFRMSIGQVLIQSYSAEEMRGRVVAVWFMQFQLTALGTFFVGLLAEWFGPQLSIGGLAGVMGVIMVGVLLWVPRMKRLE